MTVFGETAENAGKPASDSLTGDPAENSTGTGEQGRLIGRRYRLQSHVGSGGMGTVWKAFDELLRRSVAVKEVLLSPGLPERERDLLCERTLREARAAAALNHSSVVQVYDVVEDGNRPWIVMELLDARSLADIVKDDGPLSPRKTAEVGLAVLSALEAAHRAGVLHRDVKPGNVLIGNAGRVVLTDFGVARSPNETPLTSTGLLLGSPQYIAPERARGRPFGPASDLFSLGATLYAAVEGRPPFDRGDPLPTMTAVVCEPPDAMTFAGPLEPTLLGLLEKDPDRRWDADETRAGLHAVLTATTPRPAQAPAATGPDAEAGKDNGRDRRSSRGRHRHPAETKLLSMGGIASALKRPLGPAAEPTSAIDPRKDARRGAQAEQHAQAAPAAPRYADPRQANPRHAEPRQAEPQAPSVPVGQQRSPMTYGVAAPPATVAPQPAEKPQPTSNLESFFNDGYERTTFEQHHFGVEQASRSHRGDTERRPIGLIVAAVLAGLFFLISGIYLIASPGDPTGKFVEQASSTPDNENPMTSYEDPSGFSLEIPDGWREVSVNKNWVEFRTADDAVWIRVYTTPNLGSSVKPMAKALAGERHQQSRRVDYKRVSLSETEINGQDAAIWEWTQTDKGITRHQRTAVFVIDGVGYEVSLSAPSTLYEKYRKLHQPVIESFDSGA